jgi:hypothetical protein
VDFRREPFVIPLIMTRSSFKKRFAGHFAFDWAVSESPPGSPIMK